MKKIICLLTCMILIATNSMGASFKNENLKYIISYKWGLIHKDAGDATLSLHQNGDRYNLMLTAKTKPWADKIYKVRDTLSGAVKSVDLSPIYYKKTTHEKGKFAEDNIHYTTYKTVTKGDIVKIREKDGKIHKSTRQLTATGPVFDMLSVFYYLRTLDYSKLQANHVYKATVFSGNQSESITIRSMGKEKIKLRDKSTQEAYHIKFKFTRDGGRKSSDDIDTWISADSSHIPLYLVGKLPIGEVRVYYTK